MHEEVNTPHTGIGASCPLGKHASTPDKVEAVNTGVGFQRNGTSSSTPSRLRRSTTGAQERWSRNPNVQR